MTTSILIQILIIFINKAFAKEVTDILYNLTDFTPKNTRIGNLIQSTSQKTDTIFEVAILMNFQDEFEMKKNGDLMTIKNIERDKICTRLSCCKDKLCIFQLKAHLFNKIPTSFNVTIQIIDSNNNKPTFSTVNNSIFIPESAEINATFKLPIAVDLDSEDYGILGYELQDSTKTFQNIMISNEPYLKLIKPLDREKISTYNSLLLAYGKGEPAYTTTLSLLIRISDVNDNAPYFVNIGKNNEVTKLNTSGIYTINIEENKSGMEIYTFFAQDNDEGENAKITYSISRALSQPSETVRQKFSLVSPEHSAKIQLRQGLDYENQIERLIHLVIIATDNGNPARSASITLTVSLIDVNDNAPVITESNPKDISENCIKKDPLKILSVTDKDIVSNHKVDCELSEKSKTKFFLKSYVRDIYSLFNNVTFDYEHAKEEIVTIVCTDNAEPRMVNHTDFIVKITDENDNIPQWMEPHYFKRISEDSRPDQTIISVKATDADSNRFGKLFYNVTGSSIQSPLHFIRLNPDTGDIQMTAAIDRENFPQLVYEITVTDNMDTNEDSSSKIKQHSNKTKITIEIADVNDNPPEFLGHVQFFQISEDSPINTIIGQLNFKDKDEYPDNRVTISIYDYSSYPIETSHWFTIIENDTIAVKNKLDRETLSNASLIVLAKDHGRPPQSTTINIHIKILDVNDNPPILTRPENNSFISGEVLLQTAPQNTKLIQLEARDDDLGSNASIYFKLLHSNLSNTIDVKINENTGEIFTNWDRFNLPDVGVYFIFIIISDKGTPSLSTHIKLYINITSSINSSPGDYMSNIVILILIIVCSLALIVSLIAAIFWVRFRVSNDSPNMCQEEYFEREHLNKEMNTNQYSLINLDKSFRQNSYENNRLNSYETYQGFHHDTYIPNRNHTNYSHNTIHDVLDKPRMTPCEDCLTVYGTVPAQFNRFDTNLSRLRHPIIPDINTTFNGNVISANPKNFILQSYCENEYKNVSISQPPTLLVEPNFSDSGKGGSVEDLNYRQYTGISTFTNSSFVNTSSANAKVFCQNPNVETNLNQCLYDKSSETMF